MSEGLRDALIGAWKLVSYQEIPVDGSDPFEPLGHEPRGLIMYTPDGYMSAQLSKPDRPSFESGDWFAGTDEDYAAEASLFPNWTGQTQPRRIQLDGDTLKLGTVSPIRSGGKTVNSVLTGHRAPAN